MIISITMIYKNKHQKIWTFFLKMFEQSENCHSLLILHFFTKFKLNIEKKKQTKKLNYTNKIGNKLRFFDADNIHGFLLDHYYICRCSSKLCGLVHSAV